MRRLALFAVACSVAVTLGLPVLAQDTTSSVVVRVGTLEVRAKELEQELARLPRYQLRSFGETPEAIRRNYVSQVIVPELLEVQEARARGLETRSSTRGQQLVVLRDALLNDLRTKVTAPGGVTDEELRSYYEANLSQFNTPERLQIWRILVDSEAEATAILTEMKKDRSTEVWTRLARDRSKDESTNQRRGNLGYVTPDGKTNMPRLLVEPALFAAASAVKNGELVDKPVPEGTKFAVVWRRGSVPAVSRSLEQEALTVRQVLVRKKLGEQLDALIERLRREQVGETHPELLEYLTVNLDGDFRGAPSNSPPREPRKPDGDPAPTKGERGSR